MPRAKSSVVKDKHDDLSVASDSDNEKIQKSSKLAKVPESKKTKAKTKTVEAKKVTKNKPNPKPIVENEENENSDEEIDDGIEELRKAQRKKENIEEMVAVRYILESHDHCYGEWNNQTDIVNVNDIIEGFKREEVIY